MGGDLNPDMLDYVDFFQVYAKPFTSLGNFKLTLLMSRSESLKGVCAPCVLAWSPADSLGNCEVKKNGCKIFLGGKQCKCILLIFTFVKEGLLSSSISGMTCFPRVGENFKFCQSQCEILPVVPGRRL